MGRGEARIFSYENGKMFAVGFLGDDSVLEHPSHCVDNSLLNARIHAALAAKFHSTDATAVSFGKLPSWSLLNKKGQAINTHWIVRFEKGETGVKSAGCFLQLLKHFANLEFEKSLQNVDEKMQQTAIDDKTKPEREEQTKLEHGVGVMTRSQSKSNKRSNNLQPSPPKRRADGRASVANQDNRSRRQILKPTKEHDCESDDDASKNLLDDGSSSTDSKKHESDDSFQEDMEDLAQVAMSQPLVLPFHHSMA